MKFIIPFLSLFFCFIPAFAQESGGPYSMDENTALLMHFEGNLNNPAKAEITVIPHGTGVNYESGKFGQCLRLDNSTSDKMSWIEIPHYDELAFSDEFTIECWFKLNSWGDDHSLRPFLIKKGMGWQADFEVFLNQEYKSLIANMNGEDDDYYRDANNGTTDIIETGKWYYISVSFNIEHHHFYLVLKDENLNEIYASHDYSYTSAYSSTDQLMIGFSNNGDSYFDGWIDELRISNKYRLCRNDILSGINTEELKESVAPLLKDKWKVYQWPFNAYFPKSSETGELHKGNSCGITALMRLIHYWEFPRFPEGLIDYNDGEFHWYADFDNTEYRFDEMPYVFGSDPSEEEYGAAATMVAQVAAAAKYFQIGGGGAAVKTILERYFGYNENLRIVYREEYTKEEWENIFKNELSNGRPIMIEGTAERFDDGSWAGHYYVCDGYSQDNKFHTDLSIGSVEWWTDIDSFEYGRNQCALIFAEPDLEGKSLILDAPVGGEYLIKGSETEIRWTASGIENLLLEYSVDAGKNWNTINENQDAAAGIYNWEVPDMLTDECRVRMSDVEDGNIYCRSESFQLFEDYLFQFDYPQSDTYFQSGTRQNLYWESTGIDSFLLEYSNGDNWEILCNSVYASNGEISCEIPELELQETVLKATSLKDNDLVYYSEKFWIGPEALAGGVYREDENTVLLLHFEGNIDNAIENNVVPQERLVEYSIFESNYDLHLGYAFLINNTLNSDWHCLRIPHTEELNLGNEWTVETWVKYRGIGGSETEYPMIIKKEGSFGIWLDGDGNGFGAFARFADKSEGEFFQNQNLEKGKWYHVAITSDAANRKIRFFVHNEERELIYENYRGFPVGETGELYQTENDVFIGGVDGGSNIQFDGWLDELRISTATVDYSSMTAHSDQIEAGVEISCYPNPIDENSVLQFSLKKDAQVNLTVFDMQGRLVEIFLNKKLKAGDYTLPVGNLAGRKGIYFCKLNISEGYSVIKLLTE